MRAEAVLLQDVENLGERGQPVDVSPGYLRNYLIPRKLAQPATPGALEEAQRRREAAERAEGRAAERKRERGAALEDGADDPSARRRERRAVGSVGAKEIAEAIREAETCESTAARCGSSSRSTRSAPTWWRSRSAMESPPASRRSSPKSPSRRPPRGGLDLPWASAGSRPASLAARRARTRLDWDRSERATLGLAVVALGGAATVLVSQFGRMLQPPLPGPGGRREPGRSGAGGGAGHGRRRGHRLHRDAAQRDDPLQPPRRLPRIVRADPPLHPRGAEEVAAVPRHPGRRAATSITSSRESSSPSPPGPSRC